MITGGLGSKWWCNQVRWNKVLVSNCLALTWWYSSHISSSPTQEATCSTLQLVIAAGLSSSLAWGEPGLESGLPLSSFTSSFSSTSIFSFFSVRSRGSSTGVFLEALTSSSSCFSWLRNGFVTGIGTPGVGTAPPACARRGNAGLRPSSGRRPGVDDDTGVVNLRYEEFYKLVPAMSKLHLLVVVVLGSQRPHEVTVAVNSSNWRTEFLHN